MGQCLSGERRERERERERMDDRIRRCQEQAETNARDIRTLFNIMECPRHCSFESRMEHVEGEVRRMKNRQPSLPPRRRIFTTNVDVGHHTSSTPILLAPPPSPVPSSINDYDDNDYLEMK